MKRILLPLVMLLVLTTAQAQRKRTTKVKKAPVPQLPQITLDSALAIYDFDAAEQWTNYELTQRKKAKEPTLEQEERLQWLQRARMKLNAVERVTFIDSIIVPRNRVLKHIQLSPECGKITTLSAFLQQRDTMDCTVFQSEIGDQVYYAKQDEAGSINLYRTTLYSDGTSSEPTLLNGISASGDHQNYPFMLPDGTTIYFAAQGRESLGGYDIFMSRYDADERRFLAPENIGMPFNSPANDYLYVIDEFRKLGWFVTDRNTSGDSVCIYTFIPKETRNVYPPEEVSIDTLRQLARITSIQATWDDADAVRAAQIRHRAAVPVTSDDTSTGISFVVTDNMIYHQRKDFRSDIAQKHFDSWLYAREELQKTRTTLERMRLEYRDANDTRRRSLRPDILTLEANEEQFVAKMHQLEKEIRKAELGL